MTGTRLIIYYYLNSKGRVIYFLLDYEKTKDRLRVHFDAYNAQLKANQPELYGKLSLKSAYLATADTLISVFGGFLQDNRILKRNPERPFIVVLQSIGNRKKNHRCTIYRHLDFLMQAGIVLYKKNLGNHQGVEINLNPKLLIARVPIEEGEFIKLRAYQTLNPHVDLKEFLKKEISFELHPKGYVAKYSTFEKVKKNNLNAENKNSFPVGKNLELDFLKEKKEEGVEDVPDFLKNSMERVLRAEKNNVPPAVAPVFKVAGDDPSLAADIEGFTSAAWSFAKKMLYAGQEFDLYQEALSKARIREYFSLISYRYYREKVTEFLSDFLQRVLLARNYIGKRPERYIPVPWKYFDRHFDYGFKGTYGWLQKVKAQQRKNAEYHRALTQVSHLFAKTLKDPQWKEKSEVILSKQRSQKMLHLYRECVDDFTIYNSNTFRRAYQEGFA